MSNVEKQVNDIIDLEDYSLLREDGSKSHWVSTENIVTKSKNERWITLSRESEEESFRVSLSDADYLIDYELPDKENIEEVKMFCEGNMLFKTPGWILNEEKIKLPDIILSFNFVDIVIKYVPNKVLAIESSEGELAIESSEGELATECFKERLKMEVLVSDLKNRGHNYKRIISEIYFEKIDVTLDKNEYTINLGSRKFDGFFYFFETKHKKRDFLSIGEIKYYGDQFMHIYLRPWLHKGGVLYIAFTCPNVLSWESGCMIQMFKL